MKSGHLLALMVLEATTMRLLRSRFEWREWYWTLAHESLFDLDDEALFFYRLIIKELR